MTVSYEWCVTTDPDSANNEVWHYGDFGSALAALRRNDGATLELVRDAGNDVDGLTDRSWALFDPQTGALPAFTDYGSGEQAHRVPKRFHDQAASALK